MDICFHKDGLRLVLLRELSALLACPHSACDVVQTVGSEAAMRGLLYFRLIVVLYRIAKTADVI